MQPVFVSYVRDNAALVDRLVRDLRQAGVTVWLDREAIVPGQPWHTAIEQAIRGGAFFLACFSQEYLGRSRTYMDEELALARWMLTQQDPAPGWFLPVLLNHCSEEAVGLRTDARLRTVQVVSLAGDWADGVRRLVGVLSPAHAYGRCRNAPVTAPGPPAPAAGRGALLAIDFGTSYTLAAYQSPDRQWVAVTDEQGRALQPSAVTFADDWDYFVAWEALAAAQHRPDRVALNIKRRLVTGEDQAIGHKRFDPVTLSALVVRHVCALAQRQTGVAPRQVLVSRPADFSAAQCTALRQVFERAGLQVVRMVAEPNVAAFVAEAWARARPVQRDALGGIGEGTLVVVDVGGGTTDVSVVELANVDGEVQVHVQAVAGDNALGGMDYDAQACAALHASGVAPRLGRGLVWGPVEAHRLRLESTRAKEALAKSTRFTVQLADVEVAPGELATLDLVLTRQAFRQAVAPLDQRLAALVDEVLARCSARAWRAAPSAVLLAGQGARIFTIAEYLRRRFAGLEIVTQFQESAVSRGLAAQAAVLDGLRPDLLLLDATSRPILLRVARVLVPTPGDDLGAPAAALSPVGADNRALLILVAKDTTIPWKYEARIQATQAGTLAFEFIEGDRRDHRQVEPLANVAGVAAQAGETFRLTVDIDANATVQFLIERTAPERAVAGRGRWSSSHAAARPPRS